MNYKQRIEHSKEIIEHNRYLIYHLPTEYKNLEKILQHQGIRDTLLKIFKYIKDKEIFIYRRKYVFFLDNSKITNIRGRTTESVSNRYINYLCAIGLINKQYQNLGEYGDTSKTRLTDINLEFLIDTKKRRPINTFYFREYTSKELKRLDSRAKQLLDNRITPGNISFNMLCANNCKSLADEVYYANDKNSIKNKNKAYISLLQTIEDLLQDKGYTTKQEIYNNNKNDCGELDKLFKIYRADLQKKYNYKAPTKADRTKYNIATNNYKWIITRR